MIDLGVQANERSTYIVDVGPFTDEAAATVTPSSITWTLTDEHGTVVNSRSAVVVTPASTIHIVLSGADLAVGGSPAVSPQRRLLVRWTYNSTLGSGLPGSEEYGFVIRDFVGI